MTRREWMLTTGAGAVRPLAGQRRPNVVILLADDQRHDTIRALGNDEVRTPHLDRLAARGTAFTHTFIMGGSVPAVCIPSRAMLLSGQSLHHVDASIVRPAQSPERARKPFVLFPELFRKAGYTTHGIGKWHNGPALYARCFSSGDNVFFGGMTDQFRASVHGFDPSGEYPKTQARPGEKHTTELFTDSAVRFLKERRASDPFLLYVSYTSPHDPRTAPKQYHDLYTAGRMRIPRNFLAEHPFDNGELKVRDELLAAFPRTEQEIRRHIADYYAMISHLDAQVGRVFDTLDETGRARDTIVVFAADNGLAVGQHGLMGKQNLYDHSVRVPLVVSGPGVPRGERRDQFCYLMDLYPTLCDLTGVASPATVEGMSLAPAIRDRRVAGRDSLYFAYRQFQRGVRTRDWKLLRYRVGGAESAQLFRVSNDPLEMHDLAADPSHAGRVREMTALLEDWMRRTGDPLI